MRAELSLPSVKEVEPERKKRPINVKFEIPYFTTSGIQVRYLKIIEPKVRFVVFPKSARMQTDSGIAAISVLAVGEIYHAKWGHHRSSARRPDMIVF